VLPLHFHAVGVEEGEGHLVAEVDVEEAEERLGRRQAEQIDEELRGGALVPRVHDGVVELDGHVVSTVRGLR
jgi:hypothetical protein